MKMFVIELEDGEYLSGIRQPHAVGRAAKMIRDLRKLGYDVQVLNAPSEI